MVETLVKHNHGEYMSSKSILYFLSIFLLVALSQCDLSLTSSENDPYFQESGEDPLPSISGSNYKTTVNLKDHLASNDTPKIDWSKVEPLLKKAQKQEGGRYVALYSVQDSTTGNYFYRTARLQFSPQALQEAKGEIQPYFFESSASPNSPIQLLTAYIPAGKQAHREMERWIRSKPKAGTVFRNERKNNINTSEIDKDTQSEYCFVPEVKYYYYDSNGDLYKVVTVGRLDPCSPVIPDDEPEDNMGGGNPDGGIPCPEQLIPPPECGGSGPSCPPPYYCGDPPGGNSSPTDIIVVEESFANNPCLSSVYAKAGKAPSFDNILKNFDGEFSVANLILSAGVDATYPNANAVTYPPSNYNIEVKFNPNNLDRPSLSVAGTLIHELIHAEMYRKLLSVAQEPEYSWTQSFINSIRNDFPGIYYYYMEYKDWQHEQMASHYRSTMKQALREFDASYSNDIYEALAWNGLQGTVAFENSVDLESLRETLNEFKQNNPSCE